MYVLHLTAAHSRESISFIFLSLFLTAQYLLNILGGASGKSLLEHVSFMMETCKSYPTHPYTPKSIPLQRERGTEGERMGERGRRT